MRLVEIDKRMITIELDPEECVRLKAACLAAADVILGCESTRDIFSFDSTDHGRTWPHSLYFMAMASMFEGIAYGASLPGRVVGGLNLPLSTMRQGELGRDVW